MGGGWKETGETGGRRMGEDGERVEERMRGDGYRVEGREIDGERMKGGG